MTETVTLHTNPNRLQLTEDQRWLLKQAFSDEQESSYIERRVLAITNIIEAYFLPGLKVPLVNKKIQAYLIGYGGDGAEEAWALQLAAKRVGINLNSIGIEIDDNRKLLTDMKWKILVKCGLVDQSVVMFLQRRHL